MRVNGVPAVALRCGGQSQEALLRQSAERTVASGTILEPFQGGTMVFVIGECQSEPDVDVRKMHLALTISRRFAPPSNVCCRVSWRAPKETPRAAAASPLELRATCAARRSPRCLPATVSPFLIPPRRFLPGQELLSCRHYQSVERENQGRWFS